MVKTNIITLLTDLHNAGIRVSLLDEYRPAVETEKADASEQKLRFKQTVDFYKMPEYAISSAGNLNVTFCLEGVAVDVTSKVEYPAKQFKSVSFVKNGKIFKQQINIHPDDVQAVIDMGYEVNGNVIDISDYEVVDGVTGYNDDAFAKIVVENYLYESVRVKAKRGPAKERTESEKWLIQNGYDPDTHVWKPVIVNAFERVKNVGSDTIGWVVNEQKSVPRLDDCLARVADKKKISMPQQKILDVFATGYNATDNTMMLNLYKYIMLAQNIHPKFRTHVDINGVDFDVQIHG